MKRLGALAALGLALMLAGGKELRNVELIRVVGIDNGKTNLEIRLTAAEGGEEAAIYETEGEDYLAAAEALKEKGARRLELTHVTAVILGDGTEVEEILWQQVLHRKSGYGATVWLAAEGDAGAVIRAGTSAAARLENLKENGGVAAPTVMEALRDLRENGKTNLPEIDVEKGEIVWTGWRTVTAQDEAGR